MEKELNRGLNSYITVQEVGRGLGRWAEFDRTRILHVTVSALIEANLPEEAEVVMSLLEGKQEGC